MSQTYSQYMSEVSKNEAREYAEDTLLNEHLNPMKDFILSEVESDIKRRIEINWYDEQELKEAKWALAELTIFFKTGEVTNLESLKNAIEWELSGDLNIFEYTDLSDEDEIQFVFNHIIAELNEAIKDVK